MYVGCKFILPINNSFSIGLKICASEASLKDGGSGAILIKLKNL